MHAFSLLLNSSSGTTCGQHGDAHYLVFYHTGLELSMRVGVCPCMLPIFLHLHLSAHCMHAHSTPNPHNTRTIAFNCIAGCRGTVVLVSRRPHCDAHSTGFTRCTHGVLTQPSDWQALGRVWPARFDLLGQSQHGNHPGFRIMPSFPRSPTHSLTHVLTCSLTRSPPTR